jgi:hypothetical protein
MGYIGKALLKHDRFVVARAALGAIPPAEDGHLKFTIAKISSDELDTRSFARATHAEVANADHGHRDTPHADSAIKATIAPGHTEGVDSRGKP